ncbi:hypothetical protein C8T65DRAFT_744781 [Cerioporus squamosus]|nr:hypothetical protein C8T65DRAFT_744781 [Cerioporus squamosus]
MKGKRMDDLSQKVAQRDKVATRLGFEHDEGEGFNGMPMMLDSSIGSSSNGVPACIRTSSTRRVCCISTPAERILQSPEEDAFSMLVSLMHPHFGGRKEDGEELDPPLAIDTRRL